MTQFRHVLYAPNGAKICQLPAAIDTSFSSPFNEVSAASLSYRPGQPNYEALLNPVELAVEASRDGSTWVEIPNGRYIRLSRDYEKIGPTNTRKFTFTGYGWQLKKVIQWQTTGLNADGKRPFLTATVGTIVKTLVDEAHARGTVPGLTYDFSTTQDSSGTAWNKVITIYYEPGVNLYTILDNLSQQGMCDWRLLGRTLQLFNSDGPLGQTRSSVKLKPGVDLKALPIQGNIENMVNSALVIGDQGSVLPLSNPTAVMPWGNWETSISNSGVSDPTTMQLLGQALLEDGAQERLQFTAEMKMDTGQFNPFFDFASGDYIFSPSEGTSYESYRVRQINGSTGSDGAQQIDLVLNDRFVEREIRNAKKTNGITGGATAGGSGGRPTPPSGDRRVPKAPQGLVADMIGYVTETGQPMSRVQLTWDPVTQATDNSAIEDLTYRVEQRYNILSAPWMEVTEVSGPSAVVQGLDINVDLLFRVRAVANPGARFGAYSATVPVTTGPAEAPPPKPSKPVLTSKLGTVTVRWDGKTAAGGAMPVDLSFIQVWRQGPSVPEAVGVLRASNQGDLLVLSGLPISLQTFWFTAVNTAGANSENSDQTAITVVRITGPDLEANSVTANEMAVGSITAAAMAADSVTAGKIALGVVSANMVRNGSFEDLGIYPPPGAAYSPTTLPGWTYFPQSSLATETGFRYLGSDARNGRGYAVIRQGTNAGNGGVLRSAFMPVTPGGSYRIIAPSRAAHNSTTQVRLLLLLGTDGVNWTNVQDMGTYTVTLGSFQMLAWNYAIPAGYTYMALQLEQRGDGVFANNTNAVIVDDVSVVPIGGAALEITPGAIRFFNSLGNETINIDGQGASITAGTLSGMTITGNTITGGTVSGTTISGTTINGGTINGTTITGATVSASGGSLRIRDGATLVFGDLASPHIRYRSSTGTGSLTLEGAFFTTSAIETGGHLFVSGFFTALGAKSFAIPHPDREGWTLAHAATESPYPAVEYWGRSEVGDDGSVVVELPDYFVSLVRPDETRLPMVSCLETPGLIAAEEIEGNTFVVRGEPGQKFGWHVYAARDDVEFPVEMVGTPEDFARGEWPD